MRFAFVLSSFLATMAAAESGSSTSAAPASSVGLDPAQASQQACLKACKSGDVNCQAHCIGVPSPDASQVNQTTACVAKCPQGNGSAAETQVYSQCVDKCVNANYFVTSEGTPTPTGAAGGNNAANSNSDSSAAAPTDTDTSGSSQTDAAETTGTDTGAAPTGSSTATSTKSSSSSGTKTGSAAATSSTGAAPAIIASGGAIVGVVAALLAL